MIARSNTKDHILSSNQSRQSLFNQRILIINPDSAQTHQSRPNFNNESEGDVVREYMVDKQV